MIIYGNIQKCVFVCMCWEIFEKVNDFFSYYYIIIFLYFRIFLTRLFEQNLKLLKNSRKI